jgi:hypothetical protein
VGLSLSLFVLLDQKISDTRYRTLSFFFMGIIAFLTTLVQGTTMTPLLRVRASSAACPPAAFATCAQWLRIGCASTRRLFPDDKALTAEFAIARAVSGHGHGFSAALHNCMHAVLCAS